MTQGEKLYWTYLNRQEYLQVFSSNQLSEEYIDSAMAQRLSVGSILYLHVSTVGTWKLWSRMTTVYSLVGCGWVGGWVGGSVGGSVTIGVGWSTWYNTIFNV